MVNEHFHNSIYEGRNSGHLRSFYTEVPHAYHHPAMLFAHQLRLLTCSGMLRLTWRHRIRWWRSAWRHTHVYALVFRAETIVVALAAAVPEDAADEVLDVVEPVLFPAGAVFAFVSLQLTHVLWQVVYASDKLFDRHTQLALQCNSCSRIGQVKKYKKKLAKVTNGTAVFGSMRTPIWRLHRQRLHAARGAHAPPPLLQTAEHWGHRE